jgi:hypothetical protein
MQLIRFSRVPAGTLFLVTAALPAFGQPTIPGALRGTDSAGGSPFGNVAFINSDEQGVPFSSECTGWPRAPGRMIGQNVFPIGRDTYPRDAFRRKSPQDAIMHWVVNYLNISKHLDLPCIKYGSSGLIAVVRYKNSHSKRLEMGAYDDDANTIYLPEGWTGRTPAEISILVHQMVYHVQNLAGLTYECSWERERLAYSAQEKWLRLHQSNLWESFGIDRTIFLLSAEYIC